MKSVFLDKLRGITYVISSFGFKGSETTVNWVVVTLLLSLIDDLDLIVGDLYLSLKVTDGDYVLSSGLLLRLFNEDRLITTDSGLFVALTNNG